VSRVKLSTCIGAAVLVLATPAFVTSCNKSTAAASPDAHHATGTIKSFGPARAFVNIAHDDIPGYMSAMTMSFEPQTPTQLDGFAAGDRVSFDFYETSDSRRVITRIEKAK